MKPGSALVRRPSRRLAEGIVTHLKRVPVDVDLALAQWEAYVGALRAAGWRPVEVAPAEDCPDSVFVEDTMVVYGDLAVITRPGAETRLPELDAAEAAVAELGLRVARIAEPETLDGGDVLIVGEIVYVGIGGRTTPGGATALGSLLEPLGARVVPVALGRFLHLKSAVTALPDGTVVGWPPVVPELGAFPRFLAVPEESGAHVALLGGKRLLIAADCPQSAEFYSSFGFEPVAVDISEFQKLEGCVTCLSVLVSA